MAEAALAAGAMATGRIRAAIGWAARGCGPIAAPCGPVVRPAGAMTGVMPTGRAGCPVVPALPAIPAGCPVASLVVLL